jgi:CRISPR system Cascade subunit CasB
MTPKEQAHEAARWWRELQPDRAALARLRRAATPIEAAEEPATIDLARRLRATEHDLETVALCTAVLAHVRQDDTLLTAQRLGGWTNGRPLVSLMRFRRLLQAETAADRLIHFRRAVALANQTLNVADLAEALLDWSERRRIAWIFSYHNAPPPNLPQQLADAEGAPT